MSFSKDAKLEILKAPIGIESEGVAFLSGLIQASGEINLSENGVYSCNIVTDVSEIYEFLNEVVSTLYGEYLELQIEDGFTIHKTTYYKIIFGEELSLRLLQDVGVIVREGAKLKVVRHIDDNVIFDDAARRAFIKGAFVGCCTSNIKISENLLIKTTSGYHLEFTSHSYEFLTSLASLLAEFDIFARLIKRRNQHVLYIKDAGSVETLLALVGANNAVIKLTEEMVVRQMRNKANREANCMTANISKTVDASLLQAEAIEYIIDMIGLESLPEDLEEIALVRLANEEESLAELAQLMGGKYTKSGINHRLGRLVKIANQLKKG